MKQIVIEEKGKFFNFKNRKVRTPVVLNIADSELKQIKISLQMAGIKHWRFEETKEEEAITIFTEEKEVIIEELDLENGDCEL